MGGLIDEVDMTGC